jgi:hypothetical protein
VARRNTACTAMIMMTTIIIIILILLNKRHDVKWMPITVGNGKVVPVFNQALRHEDAWGYGNRVPCILNFGIGKKKKKKAPPPPKERFSWSQLYKRLRVPQSRHKRGGCEDTFLSLP